MSQFKTLRRRHSPALGLELIEREHERLGCRHLHWAAPDQEKGFAIAFRTLPNSSRGQAHALEHLALCGSAKFPTRDPFFLMTRRSLATFMNAMTYSDKTIYPFSTESMDDYFNLMDVYLDATLRPLLKETDCRQEASRMEPEDVNDPKSPMAFKGVVFNEMKGAMAGASNRAYYGLRTQALAGTPYQWVSGGEPIEVLDLTIEELRAFHAEFYHPSNAVFISYGDVRLEEIDARLLPALAGFERKESNQKRITLPAWGPDRHRSHTIPAVEGEPASDMTTLVWSLGSLHEKGPLAALEAAFLERALIGDSSTPVTRRIESAGFGSMGISGLLSSEDTPLFLLGMSNLLPEQKDAARALLLEGVKEAAEKGLSRDRLEDMLDEFELDERAWSQDEKPAIETLLRAAPLALAGEDVLDGMDSSTALKQLRENLMASDEGFKAIVKKLLSENPETMIVDALGDERFEAKKAQEIEEKMARESAALTLEDRERLARMGVELAELQKAPADVDCLPKIEIAQIPKTSRGQSSRVAMADTGLAADVFEEPSNGLIWAQISLAPKTVAEGSRWLSLAKALFLGLGNGERDFAAAETWRDRKVGAIHADLSTNVSAQSSVEACAMFNFSARAIETDSSRLFESLSVSLLDARFDESERIAYLLDQSAITQERSLAKRGDGFAKHMALSSVSPVAAAVSAVSGIERFHWARELAQLSKDADGAREIREKLDEAWANLLSSPARFAIAGGAESVAAAQSEWQRAFAGFAPSESLAPRALAPVANSGRPHTVALVGPTQVNACHWALPAPALGHDDTAALITLGAMMQSGFLHGAVREQGGAYGVGSRYDAAMGAFVFSSYRDPRMEGTFADFERGIEWALSGKPTDRNLEEAILSVVGKMDQPEPFFSRAQTELLRRQKGWNLPERQKRRETLLSLSMKDVRAAAEKWLAHSVGARAAFVSPAFEDAAQKAGYTIEKIELGRIDKQKASLAA